MNPTQHLFGKIGEAEAVNHLKKIGYKIVEVNYRTGLGEIDIIAKENDALVFVEVKSRRSLNYGNAKYAITPHKKKKISMVALHYLKKTHQLHVKARFDVVTLHAISGKTKFEVIQNAFELAYP